MPTCPECNKRAAKRNCPALRTKICPVCCAEERMIKLACPEDCGYLRSARESAGERERELRQREAAAEGRVRPEVSERLLSVLLTIENAIINTQRGVKGQALSDLKDLDALAGVENAINNLQTEESGLIYEHRAATLQVEEVSRRIRASLDELVARYPPESRPHRSEILQSLERVRDSLRTHVKRKEDERSYLRFIALYFPWPKEESGPRIVL